MQVTPLSIACERNKDPILKILQVELKDCKTVLEIGSATGQHAIYFTQHLKHLTWQPTDRKQNFGLLKEQIEKNKSENLFFPIALDVLEENWPLSEKYEAVFLANNLQIMTPKAIDCFFENLPKYLNANASLIIYGPLSYQGQFTSESNAKFNQFLKDQDSQQGVREFDTINQLASNIGFKLKKDYPMPANNQLLVFRYPSS